MDLREKRLTEKNMTPPEGLSEPSMDLEASLILDIIASIFAKWKLISSFTIVFLLAGISVAVFKAPVYVYTTGINLGTQEGKGGAVPIEPANSAAQKVVNIFSADAQGMLKGSNPKKEIPKVLVTIDGGVIYLKTKGKAGLKPIIIALHKRIFKFLKEDEDTQLRKRLAEFQQRRQLLQRRLDDVSQERSKLIADQLAENSKSNNMGVQVNTADGSNQSIIEQLSQRQNQSLAAFFNNEVFKQRFATLSDRQDSLNKQLTDLGIEVANYREPYASVIAVQSAEPVGLGRGVLVVLATVAGAIVGTSVALLLDVLGMIRRRRGTKTATQA